MTDLATGLSTADAAELRVLVEASETAHAALCAADADYTRTLADLDRFAEHLAAGSALPVRERDMARRTVASEAAVALRQSDRGMQSRMHDAHTLLTEYPATFTAWDEGRISRGHVHAVTRAGLNLPAGQRAEFDAHAATVCAELSVPRARDALNHLAERLHPQSATKRHQDARDRRCVWVTPLGDGMSRVTADVPMILGEGIHDRVDRIATVIVDERAQARVRVRDARAAGTPKYELDPGDCNLAEDTRTKDQIRADVFADLLLTGVPGFDPTGTDGHGGLGAFRAHVQIVVNATALTGADQHPAAGLCQRHHSMKQFTPWTVRQLGDGILEWTSPTGRVYIDEPPSPVVWFVPDDTSPPPF